MKEKVCGIYCIENIINHKKYIGQSADIYSRWKSHQKQARSGDKSYIHNAMRKYGASSFEYSIVEECLKEDLNERETYWIQFYDTRMNGYNLTMGGEGIKGKVYSECEKEEKRTYAEKHNLSKPVLQIDKSGNIVKEWRSCKEIGKMTNMLASNIHDCLKHVDGYRYAYGFIWIYKDEYEKFGVDLDLYSNKNINILYNKILQIDNNNIVVQIWDNIHDIVGCNNTYKYTAIYSACNGAHKTAYGYVWVYEKDYDILMNYANRFVKKTTSKQVYQFDIHGKLIDIYSSVVEASVITRIDKSNISQCARHIQKTAGGFIWLYEEDAVNIEDYIVN